MAEENFAVNHFHSIFRLFDGLLKFFFTTVKGCAILTDEHGIYELPHEFSERLKT